MSQGLYYLYFPSTLSNAITIKSVPCWDMNGMISEDANVRHNHKFIRFDKQLPCSLKVSAKLVRSISVHPDFSISLNQSMPIVRSILWKKNHSKICWNNCSFQWQVSLTYRDNNYVQFLNTETRWTLDVILNNCDKKIHRSMEFQGFIWLNRSSWNNVLFISSKNDLFWASQYTLLVFI